MGLNRTRVPLERKVLVTANDRGFLATGTPLYTFLKKTKQRGVKQYNVAPLQLVAWVPSDDGTVPLAVAPADLTAEQISQLRIAVGIDANGDGVTDHLREAALGSLNGCTIKGMDAFGPKCGVPQIEALYFDCLGCDTLSVRVRISDNKTRSFGKIKRDFSEFIGTYTPDCATCDGCDRTPDCDEFLCGIVDDLNNKLDFEFQGKPYPNYGGNAIERPFKAVKLQEEVISYCISPEDNDCEDCVDIAALTSFDVDGTVIDFSQAVKSPADDTRTLMTQLKQAAMEIECGIQENLGKHGGFVFVSPGHGACCPAQIHIFSCAPVTITGLTACPDAITQFPELAVSGACQDCDSVDETTTPTCGIAILAEQDVLECDECFFEGVPAFYGRQIVGVDVISDSPISKYTKKATLQEAQLPGGFGLEVQLKEFRQTPDPGFGNGYNPRGRYGLPGKKSKLRQIQADCNKAYCQYIFDHRKQAEFDPVTYAPLNVPVETTIAVPEKDTTTQAEVDILRQQFIALAPNACASIKTVMCDGTELPPL